MKKGDDYYRYYEGLMRNVPHEVMAENPEYRALAERYPLLSESVRLRKQLDKLRMELKSAKETSARTKISGEMKSLDRELKRLNVLKRLRPDGKRETDYKRRFMIGVVNGEIASIISRGRAMVERVHVKLEQSARETALRLPPSILDLRSLDSLDRDLALRDWIEIRRARISDQNTKGSVEARSVALS